MVSDVEKLVPLTGFEPVPSDLKDRHPVPVRRQRAEGLRRGSGWTPRLKSACYRELSIRQIRAGGRMAHTIGQLFAATRLSRRIVLRLAAGAAALPALRGAA